MAIVPNEHDYKIGLYNHDFVMSVQQINSIMKRITDSMIGADTSLNVLCKMGEFLDKAELKLRPLAAGINAHINVNIPNDDLLSTDEKQILITKYTNLRTELIAKYNTWVQSVKDWEPDTVSMKAQQDIDIQATLDKTNNWAPSMSS